MFVDLQYICVEVASYMRQLAKLQAFTKPPVGGGATETNELQAYIGWTFWLKVIC